MDGIRIRCDGFVSGSLFIPAFELRAGCLTSLQLPGLYSQTQNSLFRDLFSGTVPHPKVQLSGRVMSAKPAAARSGLLAYVSPHTAGRWLARTGRLSLAEAERTIRQSAACDPLDRLQGLAGTPRTALGLLAAWANHADTIIYSTSGLDPLGRQFIHQLVHNRLQQCSALHLAYEFVSNGARGFDAPADAVIVRAEQVEQMAGPA